MATDNRVTLIQCTNSKQDTASPARDLYDESQYFRRMREWANARGNPWFILSAKHGLVSPGTVIEPYDERGLSEQQANEIAAELSKRGVTVVDITAGRDYTNQLVPALEARGVDVINHFAGCRIGTRRSKLAEATAALKNETL